MECKMSFFKYRVMKRLFLFAVCAWAGLSLWASSVKGQGTACETRSEKVPAKVYMIKEISPPVSILTIKRFLKDVLHLFFVFSSPFFGIFRWEHTGFFVKSLTEILT